MKRQWLFIMSKDKTWKLVLDGEKDVLDYADSDSYINRDCANFIKTINHNHNDKSTCAHSRFGYLAKRYMNNDFSESSIHVAYNSIKNLQLTSMLKVVRETGKIYVNEGRGFRGCCPDKTDKFVWRDDILFPHIYRDNEIKVEKFQDGTHFYAYVTSSNYTENGIVKELIQVKDGDILKWDTYDEAYAQAQKYISSARRI